ncbi:MAG: hypothetical protein OXE75_12095 [bacterium]|nr:hypothetical protein [bacterium]
MKVDPAGVLRVGQVSDVLYRARAAALPRPGQAAVLHVEQADAVPRVKRRAAGARRPG